MEKADALNEFPFNFSSEATIQVCEKKESRCSFLMKRGIHRVGMWTYECSCAASIVTNCSRFFDGWSLTSSLCPCKGPSSPLPERLNSWKDYYEWRCIPLHSPVALLLHWPLTIYQAYLLVTARILIPDITTELNIHYLGADKELSQLAVFGELHALFPRVQVHVELVGPAIPQSWDGENVELYNYAHCSESDCSCKTSGENLSIDANDRTPTVTLRLHKGYYHDRYRDLVKDSFPHIIIGPNAGIAAFESWLPTIFSRITAKKLLT